MKSARIKKIKPGMLFIEYSLRKPHAYLSEYSHAAIDEEGFIFPSKLFFRPKKIYELHLGLPPNLEWGTKVSGKKMLLAQQLFNKLTTLESFCIKKIDVSKAFSKKCGERELVVFLEEGLSSMTVLRLSPKNWDEQLENYKTLHEHLSRLKEDEKTTPNYIIDLRLSQLAYIGKAS